jgi:phage major head subunit gpT-like protein
MTNLRINKHDLSMAALKSEKTCVVNIRNISPTYSNLCKMRKKHPYVGRRIFGHVAIYCIDIQNYNFACFVWVSNLVAHTEGEA